MAASIAGMGFGNAGVHMCVSPHVPSLFPSISLDQQHGFSYPISSLNKLREKSKQYVHPSYDPTAPLVPHGLAVAMTAPAVFNFTAPSSPDRHRMAAEVFMGKDRAGELSSVSDADIGLKLREEIQRFLDVVEVPRGLEAIGYSSSDVDSVSCAATNRLPIFVGARSGLD
jgi:hydroxyacid-oxoacid transhydrogenase